LLATVDACLVALVMMGAYTVWRAVVHPAADNMARMPWAWVIGATVSWLTISWLAGAYDLAVADRLVATAKRSVTVGVFAGGEGLAAYWLFLKTYPRPALAVALAAAPGAVLMWRAAYATTLRRPTGATRVLVLGSEGAYVTLSELIGKGHDYFRIVGLIGSGGTAESIAETAQRTGAHRIVVAPRVELTDQVVSALTSAIERGIEVLDFNTAYEEMAGKVAVDHAGDHWLAALPTRPQTSALEEGTMRSLDLIGGAVGMVLTTVLFPFIALAVRLTSPGPVIYSQQRLGRSGRPFTIFKFRSMKMDAESAGASWAGLGDPRITKVGRLLRRAHLDELPQFWNVMKGEMSLVGPRPERPEFTETLSCDIPFYRLRLSVRPGMTGLKQIKVGYAATPEEHLEVLRHDLYYIKHRSLALNLTIIARTLGSVVGLDGR
jgi:exopolysaccharide biosynthesis polyprenyl glycosylphosphotransferase